MTNEQAQIIIGNIPIDGQDECYSITEYQEAKTMAIKALEQEPCTEGDAISRAEVIKNIKSAQVNFSVKSVIDFTKHKREVQEIINGVLDAQIKEINNMPSVSSKQEGWHEPEDPPEDDDFYLVTAKVGNELIIDISEYTPKNDFWDIPHEIVAWLPLPEPYKED